MTFASWRIAVEGGLHLKFTARFKWLWWVGLIIICTILVYLRWTAISQGTPSSVDLAILAATAAVYLIPLFSEVSLFGVSLKQSIEQVKGELVGLRNQITNTNSFTSQVVIPPIDEGHIRNTVSQVMQEMGVVSQASETISSGDTGDLSGSDRFQTAVAQHVDQEHVDMFMARLAIEREIFRIKSLHESYFDERPQSIIRVAYRLTQAGILPESLVSALRDVYGFMNQAIHGHSIADKDISFVKSVVPDMLAILGKIR